MTDDRARAQRETTLRQTREAIILDAATRIFARDGMAAASMRAIAAEAGCTTGAIYPVFSSKEAVAASVLQAQCNRPLSQGLMLTLGKQKVALKPIIIRKKNL